MSDSLQPHGLQPSKLLCPWDSSGKNNGVGCHSFSRRSSRPRDGTRVSRIADKIVTVWITRETQSQASSRDHLGFELVPKQREQPRPMSWSLEAQKPIYKIIMWAQNVQSVQFSRSVVSDSATPWIAARQASLSITNSRSSPRLTSIESVMPSSHLILCRPLLLLPQSLPASGSFPMSQLFASGGQSIGVSASASVLPMNTQ